MAVPPNTAPNVSLSVDLITYLIETPCLKALLFAFNKI